MAGNRSTTQKSFFPRNPGHEGQYNQQTTHTRARRARTHKHTHVIFFRPVVTAAERVITQVKTGLFIFLSSLSVIVVFF